MSANTVLHAEFTPESSSRRSSSLGTTNPLVASILHRSFPLFVLANSTLDFFTWHTRDPILNGLYWCLFLSCIYYYRLAWLFWGLITTVLYCSFNYYVNSVYVDVSHHTPTLDDILNELDNMVTRFETLTAPLRNIKPQWGRIVNYLFIVTPVHIITLKYFTTPRVYTSILLLVIAAYHSLWFQATMRILWRSQMVRQIFLFFIGSHAAGLHNNYKILNVSRLPGNKNGKIIQFQILEHQRRWIAVGWSDKLLPYERANHTNEALQATSSPEAFTFPFNSNHWKWLEDKWSVDAEFCKMKNKEGWVYYDNYWKNPCYQDTITAYTRSRKWTRKAVLVTDHKM